MIDLARMNAAIMNAHGRSDVSLIGTGYAITPRGIFSAPWIGTAMGGMPIDRPDPTLQVLTQDLSGLPAGAPMPGDQATVGSASYTIVSPPKDTEGITELVLRAYA